MVQALKLGNEGVISCHTLLGMIMLELKLIHVNEGGPMCVGKYGFILESGIADVETAWFRYNTFQCQMVFNTSLH